MKKDVFGLSKPQESIWLTEQFFKGTNVNRIIAITDFSSKTDNIDFNLVKKALNHMIKSNDNFQTRLFLENGSVKQYFCEFENINFPIYEVESLESFINEESQRKNVFNLLESPLYEFKIYKIKGRNTGGILGNFHHLICDGFTTAIVAKQCVAAYNSLVNSSTLPNLNPDNLSYKQYINCEKEYIASQKFEKDKAYWEELFDTIPEVATIYSVKNSNSNLSPSADRSTYVINSDLIAKINLLCSDLKISLYNFFMSIFGLYISQASRLDDFVIGTPILNRTNFKEKNTPGMFISTIPFRITLDDTKTFAEFSSKIAKDTLGMLRHQKYSYGYILENLRKKDPSIPNLYNIMLSYQITKASDDDSNYSTLWGFNNCTNNDLDIHIYDINDENIVNISYDYNLNKYSKSDIDLIHPRILAIINQVLENKDILLNDIDILAQGEKEKIINEFNHTQTHYPRNDSVISLFEKQVKMTPDSPAVHFENKTLTFTELNQKANSLANHLNNLGVNPHDTVALFLDKSLEAIVSIIATLKLGAVYLPIDISYPNDRIKYMINDAKSTVFLTTSNLDCDFELDIPKVLVDLDTEIYSQNTYFKSFNSTPNDLAYIIYTSGSTGNPKGVMVANKSIIRLVKNTNYVEFSKGDKILQTGTIAFDASTFEIWGALLNGLELYLLKKTDLLNPKYFADYINKNKISSLFLTTSLFNKFCEENPKMFGVLKYLLIGGEALSYKHIKTVREANPNLNIVNGYGPTENTTFSVCYNIKDTSLGFIPIGFPISNSTCYVVSKTGKLLPPGVPGELWVGGDGVSIGYLNRPDLTKEKFIQNPFGEGTIYKTGDLVVLLPNGVINYIGRIDNQVKLRGFRIELSEIDSKILEFSGIKESVTIINNNHICSYIITNTEVNLDELKVYLGKVLPTFMIPSFITILDSLPLNTNGKVDKKSLPAPVLGLEDKNRTIVPSRNKTDEIIIDELKQILDLEGISITDSFFGIGGDSLNAITLCTHLSDKLKCPISVKNIFDQPIIKDLSDFISNIDTSDKAPQTIFKAETSKYYPLSSAQKRIYYANTVSGDKSIVYNVSGGILFNTKLAPSKVQYALDELIKNNDSFRTIFTYENGNLVQSVLDEAKVTVDIEQSDLKPQSLVNNFSKPFNLSKSPLLRAKLVFLDDGSSLLLLDTHHIVVDGTSLSIICRDFCDLYNGKKVIKNELQYTDYAVWEEEFLDSQSLKEFDEFWIKKFEGKDFTTLNLPYDYPLSNVKSYKGEKISVSLPKDTFNALENLAKENNVSSYSVFLASLYILLYKYTSETNITIGSPFAGRSFREIQNIIGMFVNNIVFNNKIDSNLSFSDFVKNIHNDVMASISNQPYPFEILQKRLNLNSNNSLFDVMFTYQNIENMSPMINDKPAEILTCNTKTSKFNLWFEIVPASGVFNLEFNTDLFKLETAKSILEHYIFILTQVAKKSSQKVSDFNMITPHEKELLESFNDTFMETNDDTVVSIFEAQVKKTPNKIACVCDNKTLTYYELNKKANSLSHHLINLGIKQNDIVCIMTNRSLETIVAMLGILKAGGAFFNVDPTYPSDRTKYYIENSNTQYILVQKELSSKVSQISHKVEIDLDNKDIYGKNFDNPNIKMSKNDLSYIIYTSGSTGTPKGVMLNQVGFANMVKAMTYALDYLRDGKEHAIASVTSTPFDIFVYEIFVSLTHGMKVVMANNSEHRNPKLLDKLIKEQNVDVMTVTPSLMKINYDNREPDTALALVKNMVFGGEPLPQKFVSDLRKLADDITIFNIYGPSEITVLSNVQNLNSEKEITVGPPIKNTQIHILDKDMNPVPIGVVGEIYISGIQVGLGYIGNPEKTNSVFLDNPFGEGKIYKSGDIGRWTFDGKVQCLGRVDHQIKLRGLRIELGEIENKIEAIDGVSSAVVNKIELDGKEVLCGYYVTDKNISEAKVRDFLRKALPPYMIPTYIIKLEKMPYTINRKIDRKALPLPKTDTVNKVSEDESVIKASKSSLTIKGMDSNESKLLQIWKNILKTNDISLDDNFFDIGGDSISAIDMQIAALKYGLNFEYADIFNFPTIRQLAHKLPKEHDDFLQTYDYSIVNEVLERNKADNFKTISSKDPGNILLIGGTGYLGSHIAYEFLTKNSGDIYFLIRNKHNVPARYRLLQSLRFYFGDKFVSDMDERIKVVAGDMVTNDGLNLSYRDLVEVVKNTSVVVNSGALVKHFGLKKEFEDINVTGTNNVIGFCKKYGKRLMHISTISVSGNAEKEASVVETPDNINDKKIFTENNLYIGQDLTNIYGITKFKAEIKVLEAIYDGLDAQILRLGNITNRYSDGTFQRNTEDNAFARRLKSYIEIGAFPRYVLGHELELTPVDLAANATVKILNHTSDCNMFHIMDPKLLSIKELLQTSLSMGLDIVPVSDRLMTDIITGILDDESRQDVVSGIVHDLDKDKKLVYTSSIRLACDFTENYLKNCRISLEKN